MLKTFLEVAGAATVEANKGGDTTGSGFDGAGRGGEDIAAVAALAG
jgi:hypothetical protein